MLLSVCHECVLQKDKATNEMVYQGPSPDEIALVDAARHLRFQFVGSFQNNLRVNVYGQMVEVELLHLFEFDSDRKRMSVIVRHEGFIKLYTKGADSIIISRLR